MSKTVFVFFWSPDQFYKEVISGILFLAKLFCTSFTYVVGMALWMTLWPFSTITDYKKECYCEPQKGSQHCDQQNSLIKPRNAPVFVIGHGCYHVILPGRVHACVTCFRHVVSHTHVHQNCSFSSCSFVHTWKSRDKSENRNFLQAGMLYQRVWWISPEFFYKVLYRPQRNCGKARFLHLSVILFKGRVSVQGVSVSGVSPGGSLSRGWSLSRGSLSRGIVFCPRGVSVWGVSGDSVWESLSGESLSGGSLSRGFSVQGVSVQGSLCLEEVSFRKPPCTVTCRRYASYRNAFLFNRVVNLALKSIKKVT